MGILGPLHVRVGGHPVTISGSRLRRLLLRLAVDAGHAVSPGELLDAVWTREETRPDGATNALQSLVSRLRRALGDAGGIAALPGGYRLAADRADVDAFHFAELAAAGRRELRAGDADKALGLLESALSLWEGQALADADGAEYADAVVVRLGQQRLQATGDLYDAHIALGRAADVVAPLEELVAGDPLQEAFTGRLMTALAAAGRTADAFAAYERLRERLADELGVDPDHRLQAQHLALLRGEMPVVATAPVPVVRRPTNIRTALTSFIGREQELTRIGELLESGRLTTIIGPGGAGKTRLSAQAASAWSGVCADGVWMVELAPVTDESNISQAVLGALGLKEVKLLDRRNDVTARDSVDRLFETLRDASTLLVIDNCEHLIAAVADWVDDVLARCPGVKILATSREPLGIVGESLCVIPPLGLPPADVTAEHAPAYPAVQLLIERAAAVSAGWKVDESNVAAVVEIVRRLDGLPLAIELAAARLRVLPATEIAARLGDRFRLLTGGNRTAMPRHRTLRAVVEWSWDLLSPAERLLAERLSVFPAGATEEAAVAICGDRALPAPDIPDLLMTLVDKSLLQVVNGAPLRYRMLETIREYGVERLAERGEVDAARTAHGRYFAELVGRLEPMLRSRDQLQAMRIVADENDNTVAALRFLGESGDLDRAVKMALAQTWHWSATGSDNVIVTWMDFLLALPGGEQHRWAPLMRASRAVSELSVGRGEFPSDGSERQAAMLAIGDDLDGMTAPAPFAPLEMTAPLLYFFSGDIKRATRWTEQLVDSSDPWVRGTIRTMRAAFFENAGDVDSMRVDVAASLADFETIGDRWGLATALNARGWIRALDGDTQGAIDDYRQAIEYFTALGGREDNLMAHIRLATLYARIGDHEAAHHSLDQARGGDDGGPHTVVRQLIIDGAEAALNELEGDRAGAQIRAARLRQEVLDRGPSHWMGGHIAALTLSGTAGIALRAGDVDQAVADLVQVYPAARETNDMPIVAIVGVSVAGLAALREKWWDAAHILGAAARLRGGDDLADPAITWVVDRIRASGFTDFAAAYEQGKLLSVDACLVVMDPAPFV